MCAYMVLFVLLNRDVDNNSRAPPPNCYCYRTPPQLLSDALPLLWWAQKCTMYAYTYIFGACGGQFLGFRN